MVVFSTKNPEAGHRGAELVLGGQKSGKSRHAEALAQRWLQADAAHQAVLLATALPADAEMQARIARHRQERAQRVPRMQTESVPWHLAEAVRAHSAQHRLVLIDCLTLWLTNWLMPAPSLGGAEAPWAEDFVKKRHENQDWQAQSALFLEAIAHAPGPVVLVGNEIGWGVIPLGREVRAFVDALGLLNQQVAQACTRVTLMAAGLPLVLKGGAA